MTHVATAIAAGDLSQRVPEATPGTEAAELGEALNSMLGSIEETFEERREVEQRLRRFVGDASHELRTPIATIRGYAELYRSGALEDDGSLDDAMERTEAEAVRMGGLVDDLLALARMDQRQPLDLGEVDLAELAADAVEDCRAMDPERSVTLEAEVPVPVRVEEARIRQVLANLVANAVVHTPSSAAIVIRVRPGDDGGGHLEVCDDGPGMDSEVASRAFERFFRAEKSRSREHGGSGLGLSIVDSIVRAHGGTATLRSAPGRGTCVMVDLPRTADPASPAN
ncbi:MAG: HAMP domain-containing histidine kinase [Microthrixaceae bacterium]|nr:HAMP domain-containing histidine kinase [Microthrixaceae bacterium]